MGNIAGDRPLVLVAEDNISNYLLIEILLKQTYRLIHAQNGQEAIDFFLQYHPQLILMDIKMPEMDGYEATTAIRQISQEVPIIAVTAYAFSSDEERILNNGFNAYISKPLDANKLKKLLIQFLH